MKKVLNTGKNLLSKFSAQLILVALIVYFGVECGAAFFSVNNLISIVRQVTTMGIAALGVSFLMITGNLDFSTGQVYAFTGTLAAVLYSQGVPIVAAMAAGVAGAIVIFCFTCWISIRFKISRLVVSMAMGTAVSGLSCILAHNKTIYGLPESIKWLGQGYVFNLIPISTIIFLVLAVIVAFVFRKTYLGRYLFAVGGSDDVARLSGINVNRIKYLASIIAGGLVGVAGLVCMSRTFSGSPFAGGSLSSDVISAAVLGGVSVTGGTGKTSGIVTGVIIIGTLSVGLNMMGMNTNSQDIFKGLMLLVAVIIDVLSKRQNAKQ
ncbi:MAG: ABC transporter permease [Firmicutes bacterium]|nr:ABC transporter permease [Bacillota bacterium]